MQDSESPEVTLQPGPAFHLQSDGTWEVEDLPPEVLESAEFSGYLTIHGYRCTVFETPDAQQWAQKSVGTVASLVASQYLRRQAKGKDLVSQVGDILHGGGGEDDKYDEEILDYCSKVRKALPKMQDIFDSSFRKLVEFKDKMPETDHVKVRQIGQEKVNDAINQAATRIELLSFSLMKELEALLSSLEVGASRDI